MRCLATRAFAVLSSFLFLGLSDAVGDDGGSKWAAGSWQLTPGAGRCGRQNADAGEIAF